MPDSPFTSVQQHSRAVVVHVLASELRKPEVDGICGSIDGALAGAMGSPFILDMAPVTFAGSLALGVLVGLNKEFKNRGQRLIFVGIRPTLMQVLKMTHIDSLIETMADVEAALASVGGGA